MRKSDGKKNKKGDQEELEYQKFTQPVSAVAFSY